MNQKTVKYCILARQEKNITNILVAKVLYRIKYLIYYYKIDYLYIYYFPILLFLSRCAGVRMK